MSKSTYKSAPASLFQWFKDGQWFPGNERGQSALETPQVIVVHDIEHPLLPKEMLIGPVQRGVRRNDAHIVLTQKTPAHAFGIGDGNGPPGLIVS